METHHSNNPSLLPWEAHAASWDETMGDDGNQYFSALELPVLKKLVSPRPEDRALDLATGNGLVARWLAQEGASVVATDGSKAMTEQARIRTRDWYQRGRLPKDKISFEVLDVTDQSSWELFVASHGPIVSGIP
jgi:2-polyprenyl-3-methyl-5-hydroxy-6-metoxy-1,4-benzoquinol methylase